MSALIHSNLSLLEVADPRLMDELMLDRQVSELVVTRLSTTVAIVEPSRFNALVARLRKLGHLPTVEE